MYLRALQGYEKALGAEHTSTLDTVNNLGVPVQATKASWRGGGDVPAGAGRVREGAGSGAHVDAGHGQQSRRACTGDQGKLAEAEAMYLRALQGYEKALGAEHTSTLDTVNNLGILYADQGKMAEAEAMYVRALQGYEKAVGADHPRTRVIARNLNTLRTSS